MKKMLFAPIILIGVVAAGLICFKFLNNETIRTNFPEEYDYLVIDHGDEKWQVPRNEKVDEFIRTSRRISEHAGEAADWYVLRFYHQGKQVYSILYDKLGYPKKAVALMNELIEEGKKISYASEEGDT